MLIQAKWYTALALGCLIAGIVAYIAPAAVSAQFPYAGGDPRQSGITVSGVGEVVVKPNVAEFELTVSGSAEIFGDALVKFRDSKRRTLEAFESLGLKNLSIEERGLSLGRGDMAEMANRAMRGDSTPALKPKVEVGTRITVRMSGIADQPAEQVLENVGKLIDTARDAGNDVGPSTAEVNMQYRYGRQISGTLARFVVEDFSAQREQAYRAAMQDARDRAARLARLSEVQLGGVESVAELQVSGDEGATQNVYVNQYGVQSQGDQRKSVPRITTDTFTDVPVRVRLQVRFGILPLASAAASTK